MVRIFVAVLPIALTPVLLHLIAYGWLDFGGGEKDLVLLLPWTLWSLVFAAASLVLWRRRWPLLRATLWSAAVGIAGLLAAGFTLAAFGVLGIAG